jgi:hypothetical protein
MKYLNKIIESEFLKTAIPYLLSCLLLFFLINQVNKTKSAKEEAERNHRNYLTSLDSIRTIDSSLKKITKERSTYEVKVSELTKEQKELIRKLGLKTNGRGNTPNSVTDHVIEYRDTIININSTVVKGNDVDAIKFTYNPKLPSKNYFKIEGDSKYNVTVTRDPKDSTKTIVTIVPKGTDLNIEQTIEIITGIYRDPKSGRLMTRVTSEFPGINFSEINSFDITDNKEARKIIKKARKPFGIGVSIGYGISGNATSIGNGINLSIGLNYSPKFLQFGK